MNIKYKADNGILIEGVYKDETFKIKFSDIIPFWQYATEEDFEDGKAKLYDKYVIASILTAGGQGGIIFVWDLEQKTVICCFESEYCVDFTTQNKEIYSLHYISHWGVSPYFQLRKTNIATEKSDVLSIELPFDSIIYNGDMNSVSMNIEEKNVLSICFEESKYLVKI